MTKLDLAASLIRSPLSAKLTDRPWVVVVLFAAAILLAGFLGRMSMGDAVNAVLVLVAPLVAAEKFKDAYIGGNAVRGDAPAPASVAVGTVTDGSGAVTIPENSLAATAKNAADAALDAGKAALIADATPAAQKQLGPLGAMLGVNSPDPLPPFGEIASGEVAR